MSFIHGRERRALAIRWVYCVGAAERDLPPASQGTYCGVYLIEAVAAAYTPGSDGIRALLCTVFTWFRPSEAGGGGGFLLIIPPEKIGNAQRYNRSSAPNSPC